MGYSTGGFVIIIFLSLFFPWVELQHVRSIKNPRQSPCRLTTITKARKAVLHSAVSSTGAGSSSIRDKTELQRNTPKTTISDVLR